ncbi:hypothetical protein [Effusibacillus dendaii]|uniref:Uncharacterized protein n=1 Tax=Effusibacillus dendaii TaxID=2743772 RepID=A0A7I8DFN6_9BACL|nr:hypothetical protein [Effusibacillus dendaii]BCJ86711.1 hypothetical protein skT53_16960 [Effusibacillus dendaii]
MSVCGELFRDHSRTMRGSHNRKGENNLAVTYQEALRFLGKPVCAECKGHQKHYGIVQRVSRKGILLQPIPVHASANRKDSQVDFTTADRPAAMDAETVFLPFLLPLTTLFSLGAYGGYGTPYGYGYGRPYGFGRPYGYGYGAPYGYGGGYWW